MEYSSAVERHFAAPKKARELPRGRAGLVAGEAEDRTLHVWVRFQLQIVDGVVAAAGFQAFGCPHTVAAASVVADWLEGRPVAVARKLDVKAVCAELEVPVEKLGKLLRIEDAVAACWRIEHAGIAGMDARGRATQGAVAEDARGRTTQEQLS